MHGSVSISLKLPGSCQPCAFSLETREGSWNLSHPHQNHRGLEETGPYPPLPCLHPPLLPVLPSSFPCIPPSLPFPLLGWRGQGLASIFPEGGGGGHSEGTLATMQRLRLKDSLQSKGQRVRGYLSPHFLPGCKDQVYLATPV